MARINIEDSLFKDKRFFNLCLKLGSRQAGIGAIVEAWMLAQSFVEIENPKGLVSIEKWHEQEICKEIVECNLAKIIGNNIEVEGADKSFLWLVDAKIKGKKGGDAKSKIKQENLAGLHKKLAGGKPEVIQPYPPTLSLSPSPILNLNLNTNKGSVISSANFYTILSPAEKQDIKLRRDSEIQEIKQWLIHEHIFNNILPVQLRKSSSFDSFAAILLHIYGDVKTAKETFSVAMNDEILKTKTGLEISEYLLSRIKNQALGVINAV